MWDGASHVKTVLCLIMRNIQHIMLLEYLFFFETLVCDKTIWD